MRHRDNIGEKSGAMAKNDSAEALYLEDLFVGPSRSVRNAQNGM